MKKYLIPLLIILAIIIVSFFYMHSVGGGDIRKNISFEMKVIEEKDVPNKVSIHAEYPEIVGAPQSVLVNGTLKAFAESRVEDFKKSLAENTKYAGDQSEPVYERSLSLRFATSTPTVAQNVVGIYFVEEDDFGGAHPGHDIQTFHYDVKTGKEIVLENVFSKTNFVTDLSEIAIAALPEKLGTYANADQIKEGAGPELDNFRAFVIMDKGLRLIFNEYQVAAYAAGVQDILIPWNELYSILNTDLIKLPN